MPETEFMFCYIITCVLISVKLLYGFSCAYIHEPSVPYVSQIPEVMSSLPVITIVFSEREVPWNNSVFSQQAKNLLPESE